MGEANDIETCHLHHVHVCKISKSEIAVNLQEMFFSPLQTGIYAYFQYPWNICANFQTDCLMQNEELIIGVTH